MKKLLLALALFLAPSVAFAQCTGLFPPNTVCGNFGATAAPPSAVSSGGNIFGPGSSTVGHVATWANTSGTLLADSNLFPDPNTQTGDYTIATTDCGGIVNETGAYKTITLPAVAGFPVNCIVRVVNGSSTRGQKLSGFPTDLGSSNSECGSGKACLWPRQGVTVAVVAGTWKTVSAPGRWRWETSYTFYVDGTNGDDNNDCLSTTTSACKTIQKAVNLACYLVDSGGQVPGIQVANGTYAGFSLTTQCVGQNCIGIIGNTGTPSNVLLTDGGVSGNIVSVQDKGCVEMNGFAFQATGANSLATTTRQFAILDLTNIVFHTVGAGGYIAAANEVSSLNLISGIQFIDITAPSRAAVMFSASDNSKLVIATNVTFTGTWIVAAAGCLSTAGGSINLSNVTLTGGTITGPRYIASLNGVIYGGAANCPGDVGGSTSLGGQAN